MSARRIYLRSSVWVQVEGAEPPRFLNALAEAEICFWGAEPEDDFTLRLALRPRDLETARTLALRCQCTIKTLKLRGAPRSEEHTSELQSPRTIGFAVLGL